MHLMEGRKGHQTMPSVTFGKEVWFHIDMDEKVQHHRRFFQRDATPPMNYPLYLLKENESMNTNRKIQLSAAAVIVNGVLALGLLSPRPALAASCQYTRCGVPAAICMSASDRAMICETYIPPGCTTYVSSGCEGAEPCVGTLQGGDEVVCIFK
jgi:hypothetical protein